MEGVALAKPSPTLGAGRNLCHRGQIRAAADAQKETFMHRMSTSLSSPSMMRRGSYRVSSLAWKCRRHFSRKRSVSAGIEI